MPTPSLLTVAKAHVEGLSMTMRGLHEPWVTVLLIEDRSGKIHTGAMMPISLEDEHLKHALQQIYKDLTDAGAVQAALVTAVWKATPRPDVRPRDSADREEFLMAIHVTRDETRVELARVLRSEETPRLAPWEKTYQGLEVGGSIADTLRSAIEHPVASTHE